jgi:two-component system, chemotaxis family, CheB/CheR fusion protein
MDRKIIFFIVLGFLFLLIISEYFIFQNIRAYEPTFFIFLAELAIVVVILFIMIWLFKRLKDERTSNYRYKIEVESLSEAGKNIQTALEKSEEKKNFLADAIPQIVWECDEKGKVVYYNKQWYIYTGLSKVDSMDDRWMHALHEDDRERTARIWQESVKTGEPYQIEYRLRNAHGEYQWFLDRGLPMKDKNGNTLKWFGTCTNIEDQKNHHMILERKIRERTTQLQELNEELERSNKELENFAYIASHDLQEPLRKIRAFGDLLKKKFTGDLSDQGKEYINRMQHASYRMQKLIDDLLSYSRVSRNPQLSETVDLTELAKEVVDDLEETIKNTHATVRINVLPTINGDRRQLKQLFQNLISNGIKFHKKNENPVVEIKPRWRDEKTDSLHKKNGRSLELIFSDNGIGFDEKYHDKIFTIFQRLHGRIEYEGTGIGLAICKKIVENHNGTIYAKSEPGVGTEFIVVLPFN